MSDYPYRPPVSEWSGYTTLVRPDSKLNLPTDLDREKEIVLPPGAATPNAPSSGDEAGPHKYIPNFVSIAPNNGIPDRPRTLGIPGDLAGDPVKYDYNMPTRRSLTSSYILFDWMYDNWGGKEEKVARQQKQRGQDKYQAKLRYMKNKAKYKAKAKKRYNRVKNRSTFKRKNKLRRKHPQRFKRRVSGVLTAPEIMFVIGRDEDVGNVHGVSALTNRVNFVTRSGIWASLPIVVFLSSVVFLTEEDLDAMFDLIDVEIGPEAFQELTVSAVQGCADILGIDWDGDGDFEEHCEVLTGIRDLNEMSFEQLDVIDNALVDNTFGAVLEGPRDTVNRDRNEKDEGDIYEVDPSDDRYYYGEVDIVPESMTKKQAGDVILYDQNFVPDPEITWPVADDLGYYPSSPSQYVRSPIDQHMPPGHSMYPDRNDNNPPASSRVVPPGTGPQSFSKGDQTYLYATKSLAARFLDSKK